jgi:hypothetical protein
MPRPRAFRLSEQTLADLAQVAELSAVSQSRVIEYLVAELVKFGPSRIAIPPAGAMNNKPPATIADFTSNLTSNPKTKS